VREFWGWLFVITFVVAALIGAARRDLVGRRDHE
jgi:hypothetical protein